MKYTREYLRGIVSALRLAIGILSFCAATVSAGELAQPEGEVILVVKGSIAHTNAPGQARFDYAMLADLGLVSEQIDTEWTPAGAVFEGIRAHKLLELVGASGKRIRVTAVNDYSVSIPFEDLADYATLLATSRDGKRLRLRDQGPLWLMYVPYDRPDEIQTILNHRMVWQLQTLEFE
ncbi:molybdopterin-dependent oxidoreductase [Granulosicoccus sp. 3-233]|uniref:molybdopterin-dependent oxidoreductase n=1 Tax=Granulosicoccus sp. 3-233 TaxID=3417969 RepID=UPI003D331BD5